MADDRPASDDEWAVLKLSAISRGSFRPEEQKALRAGEVPSRLLEVEAGDVLLTRANTPQLVGDACYVQSTQPRLIFSDLIYRLRFTQELDSRFASYWLISPEARHQIEIDARGSSRSMVKISQAHIRDWLVPIPPRRWQIAIADFLDRETAKIDRLIEQKKRLIELLQEKRTALITRAVTRGLDPDAEMKDSGVEWLGEIPAHWEVRPNRALFSERDERGYPDLPVMNVSIRSGVSLREFKANRIEQQSEDRSVYKRARSGDIVFNKMRMWQGAVGAAPADGLVSPDYTVAIPNGVNSDYYASLFRVGAFLTEVDRHSYGMVKDRNRLYWLGFKQIACPVPPTQEQASIVQFIDRATSEIVEISEAIEHAITLLREYRTALISAAVTGKIDVREHTHE